MTPPQLLTYVVSNMRKWLWHVAAFVRGKPWKYQSGYPTNPFHFTHARACVHACFPFFFLSFFLSSPPFSFLFFSFLFFSFLFFSFLPEIQTFNCYVAGPGRRLQHGDSADGPHWTCTQCTFQNHPLLDKCETCEMPRLLLGTDTCYCHPTPTKPSLTQPTGNACRETASS